MNNTRGENGKPWLGFDPSKCKSDWRTCGNCCTAFTPTVVFGECGLCGFLRRVFGLSVCPHAPVEPVV